MKQKGLTLIELIIVIIILGILAATALPRFTSLKEEANAASLNGVAGYFGSSIQLVHAQWLADGSNSAADVLVQGTNFGTNAAGFPVGAWGEGSISETNCEYLWNNILQNHPKGAVNCVGTCKFKIEGDGNFCRFIQQGVIGAREIIYDSSTGVVYVSVN